jgi:thioredoxin reductase (NADPH)
MNKKNLIRISSGLLLGFTLLCIPQCAVTNNSFGAVTNWFSTFFSPAKQKFDLKNIEGLENVYPIVIIGSGPAGSSAGLYGARAKKKTLVIEGSKPGGLLTETSYVENWPGFKAILGKDLMLELKEQAKHFGALYMDDTVEKIDLQKWPYQITTEDGKILNALTIIIATGASPSPLNIPGEKDYWGKGVTTCAICDAPFYQGKEVVVVGGGDSAVAEAIQLSAYATKITILVRKDAMRAAAANQDLLLGYPHISVRYAIEPKEIIGNGQHVTGITLHNKKTDQIEHMPVDGVFLAIGHNPNSDLFKGLVQLDKNGYVVLMGHTHSTSVPGIFAAGDVEDHRYRQAGVAAGSGIKAALDADAFLNELGFNAQMSAALQDTQRATVAISPSLVNHVASLHEFENQIKDLKTPLLVDFYADYCPSCMQMLPNFDAVAQQFKDLATFISIDIVALPDIAKKYHINKIPCLLVFKEGTLAARYSSALTKKELQEITAEVVGQTPALGAQD